MIKVRCFRTGGKKEENRRNDKRSEHSKNENGIATVVFLLYNKSRRQHKPASQ